MRVCETTVVACLDVHQGENARYTWAKDDVLAVFNPDVADGRLILVSRHTLVEHQIAPACSSDGREDG
jgi:hypothetical protein